MKSYGMGHRFPISPDCEDIITFGLSSSYWGIVGKGGDIRSPRKSNKNRIRSSIKKVQRRINKQLCAER